MDYMLREFTPNIMNFWIIAVEFQAQAGVKGKDGKLKGDEKTLMADAMGACGITDAILPDDAALCTHFCAGCALAH